MQQSGQVESEKKHRIEAEGKKNQKKTIRIDKLGPYAELYPVRISQYLCWRGSATREDMERST